MGIYRTQAIPSKIGNYMVHVGKPGVLDLGPESIVVGYEQKQIGITEPEEGQEPEPIWADDESRPIRELTGFWLYEINGDEIPTEQQVEVEYEEPEPEVNNLTDVDIMFPAFTLATSKAGEHLNLLKAKVWDYLKNVKKIPENEVTGLGVLFNLSSETGIGVAYDDFVKNGGHPLAAIALWKRIQEVKSHHSWFDSGVEEIFRVGLGQNL